MVNKSGLPNELFDHNPRQICNLVALISQGKRGTRTMKKYTSTLTAAFAALSMSFYSANAGLLGMPLNLRVAIELIEVDALAPPCQFYTDDVLTGPLLVKGC